ncbi:MAG: hypothetical protein RQ867_02855 [Mariprofundaceae bacterium]|nr:hypothetical protein [Mariprofundaceae bacterium]
MQQPKNNASRIEIAGCGSCGTTTPEMQLREGYAEVVAIVDHDSNASGLLKEQNVSDSIDVVITALLARADQRFYAARAAGRDRVVGE